MGQQQILLIVLGVIIVGVAVIVGILIAMANEREAQVDLTVNEAVGYATLLMQFYKKPIEFGGGGHNFQGFPPPAGKEWVTQVDPDTKLYYSHAIEDYNNNAIDYLISMMPQGNEAYVMIENWDLGTKASCCPPKTGKSGVRVEIEVRPTSYTIQISELFE